MKRFAASRASAHVVIAGCGFAALETLLALRALGSDHLRVTLVAPEPTFAYRPAATAEAFREGASRAYDVRAIASDLGATYRKGRLEAVGSVERYVRLSSGSRFHYQALVLAVGVRATAAIPGARMFRDQRDLPLFRRLLHEMDSGAVGRVVFALPSGSCWPLPLYELALLSAAHAAERRIEVEITVVSPECSPLAVFGSRPSQLVENLLAERGVAFQGNSVPSHFGDDGLLALRSGRMIEADCVVAGPQLWGRPITGVPSNSSGFVPTDASGRVQGLADVYAAGDITTYPVKQASVAAQQADRIAQHVLTGAGAQIPELRIPRVLQAQLLGGEQPVFLRAELDEHGRATSATLTRPAVGDQVVENKVLARYLTPYLDAIRSRGRVPTAGASFH